jgi:hypothetical protein
MRSMVLMLVRPLRAISASYLMPSGPGMPARPRILLGSDRLNAFVGISGKSGIARVLHNRDLRFA